MKMSVDIPQEEVTPGNGNETVDDLGESPVVIVTGVTEIQVSCIQPDV